MAQTSSPSSKPPAAGDLARALRELPIFPLPQAVLFPGARMPLHIFEPRYRQMTRDALDTHRMIGIAHIDEGGKLDADGHPAICRVGGLGVIAEADELPDGRFNIVLEGRARVHFSELPFVPPYRRARAELLEDRPTEVVGDDHSALVAMANAFVAFVQARDPNFHFALPTSLPAGRIADLCAHSLVLDSRARQGILEALDPATRARAVADVLATQLAALKHDPPESLN